MFNLIFYIFVDNNKVSITAKNNNHNIFYLNTVNLTFKKLFCVGYISSKRYETHRDVSNNGRSKIRWFFWQRSNFPGKGDSVCF